MRSLLVTIIALAATLAGGHVAGLAAPPSPTATATIEAEILGKSDSPIGDLAVQGATIEVKALGLSATTDGAGRAELQNVAVSASAEEPTRVDIVVSAPGYAPFTYLSVPIFPNNGPILTPVLKDTPQVDNLGVPVPPERPPSTQPSNAGTQGGPAAVTSGCSGYGMTDTPPSAIKVYSNNPDHGADYLIHTLDFHSYVQHVLPREWISGWPQESLRAGAVAVKMYGWYWTINWRGGSVNGQCYDVDSTTNYQVWDPNVGYPATNQAVDDTWDYYVMNSGGTPYQTQYNAGSQSDACGYLNGSPAPGYIMSQWGSKACADAGKVWYDILINWYYFNPPSSLKHGPHAVWSTAENLPVLAPSIDPYSNVQVRISWTGQSGVQYYRCTSSSYPGVFASSSCTLIGTGVSSVILSISTGEYATTYYRIRACQNGYCSALNAGGYLYRNYSGNTFYTTTGYIWPYAQARATTRNTTGSPHTMKLYDGVPGYGGTLQVTCSTVPAGGKCGPYNWLPGGGGSQSWWYDTGSQTVGSEIYGAVRLIPNPTGE